MLAQAKKALEGKAVKFISLSREQDGKKVANWFKKYGADAPMWAGKMDDAGANQLHTAYRKEFKYIPSTFVVDASGVILGHFSTMEDKAELLNLINPALK